MKQAIYATQFDVRFLSKEIPNAYIFAPSGRFKFLQRLAWHYLMKRSLAKAIEEKDVVEVIQFETDDIMRNIELQRKELLCFFKRDATTMLIGSEDFCNLMGLHAQRPWLLEFDTQSHYGYKNNLYCGLSIKVVPWMRGVLVMP